MNKVRDIAKNMGFLFISQIITYIIGFFITMYTTVIWVYHGISECASLVYFLCKIENISRNS